MKNIITTWRINRIDEKCAGLKAKIDYMSRVLIDPNFTNKLPLWQHDEIHRWHCELAMLLFRKKILEGK